MKYLVIGAGFAGAVIAEQLAQDSNNRILIIDERNHIGGNCFTERDKETNITIHKYGPHIFHTNNKTVWEYIQEFCEMVPFTNRVKSIYQGKVYSLPINLHTINQFFEKSLSPEEAKTFIDSKADHSINDPKNFEEQALKFIGNDLYKAFFYGYTKKQWGCEPTDLPASILKRLPVRFNYNDNYYNSQFQGIPKNGYTEIFENLLKSPNIELQLNTKFDSSFDLSGYDHVFYSGPIDAFYNFEFGRLSYRTVFFEKHIANGDFQGNAVINYADEDVPYTRIHEHKHFTPWEDHQQTVYFTEFSKETNSDDVPFYPKRLFDDMVIYEKYLEKANKEQKVSFVGRLATYRYLDMHQIIEDSLTLAKAFKGQKD